MNTHLLLRKSFTLSKIKKSPYTLYITADDYYYLYINGEFVSQGPDPGYPGQYFVNQLDITSHLNDGENTIAVHLYYQGLHNKVWNSGDLRMAFACELYNHEKLLLKTDDAWKYKRCNAWDTKGHTGYWTSYTDEFNSAKWDENWMNPDYNEEGWEHASVLKKHDYTFFLQTSKPLKVYTCKPVLVKKTAENRWFIDYGTEIAGNVELEARGHVGSLVTIRNGEEIDENSENGNRPRYEMRCNVVYENYWRLSGNLDTYHGLDYKAFRYAEVEGEGIDPESFRARVRHYPVNSEKNHFSCSNELIQKIWDICRNGVIMGTQESLLDCPTREKGQFSGDITVAGHAFLYTHGDLVKIKKTLTQFLYSAKFSPGLLAIAPGSRSQRIADYSLQLPLQINTYYKLSGDHEFLEEAYSKMLDLYTYYQKFKREDGLLAGVNEQWNLVDWPKNLRDGYDFEQDKKAGNFIRNIADTPHNVINAYYYGFLLEISRMAEFLGKEPKTDTSESERFKETFNEVFYDRNTGLFTDSETSSHSALHSNVLPLLFGLSPEEVRESIIKFIKMKKFSCGVYFAYFVMKALAKAGEHQAIIDLLTMKEDASYYNMISEGATTCFEAWGKDQKWNTSLCHAWASAPIPVLVEDIMGLKIDEPGLKKYHIEPHAAEALETYQFRAEIGGTLIKLSSGV